ncbi:WD40-repeat-containing domain protein [Polychytrium aggregatum]|uniref:WD40-repeat-containing domain protein n=1 Tax=Polychytrium aggregatum TaxID=110093 RepID=UPI0022FE6609|nr:WD40-repeat-containing domain protein [Polychytrium aggregatum]KAI9205325.1 WD40-repeat-containing domain protein [Polychytrium aggregatum]
MSYTRKATFAPQPSTVRGQAVHLGGDPKGANFLYTNGRAVIIRNLENPAIATEYSGHSAQATVARYAPSGYYIASGDVNGNIRVWDTTQAENILKTETKVFAGRVNDICWDHESKRIIAVGDGRERFGHAFTFDSASSVGEISGHSKVINACSIRQERPFRAVTCSDDMTVNFYHGVPYKFVKSITDHTRFVQCVRFSPNGSHFVSAGMDGKIFLYDGKEGNRVAELSAAPNSHTGGVFSVSWSPDSTQLLSSSADGTVKLYDVAAQQVVSTFSPSDAPGINDQQVGNLWQGQHLISLSLSGDINYFDRSVPGKPSRVVKGHQKAITAITFAEESKTLFTGSYDGRVHAWTDGRDGGLDIAGAGHTSQVSVLASSKGKIYSIGLDDITRCIDVQQQSYDAWTRSTGSQPKGLAVHGDVAVTSTIDQTLTVTKNGAQTGSLKVDYSPSVVAISRDGVELAVGSADDNKIRFYRITGGGLEVSAAPVAHVEGNRGPVTALSYSPDGQFLAAADSQRAVFVYETKTRTVKIHQWVFHTARVNSIVWSPDSLHAASGSLDTNVEVWSVANPMKHISIKGAHLESVNGVVFLDNDTIASAGQDSSIKIWSLKHF